MEQKRAWALVAFVALAIALSAPAIAHAAPNAYGLDYQGSRECLRCHGGETGRWQVGSYQRSWHALNNTAVEATQSLLYPAITNSLYWPAPTFGLPPYYSYRMSPSDIRYMMGSPNMMERRYVSRFTNDAPHALAQPGSVLPTVNAPADDLLMFNMRWDLETSGWMTRSATPTALFQSCGPCHYTGVTRSTYTTYTLASGATVGRSTPSTFSEAGIQCEVCHRTSKTGTHFGQPFDIVRTQQVFKSQTCGQCHVAASSKERTWANSSNSFGSPNGFTTDKKLTDFFSTINGSSYVASIPDSPAPTIPSNDSRFYPTGHSRSGGHSGYLYNEWMLSKHSYSFRLANGQLTHSDMKDECLKCHSGEGFLKDIDYGEFTPGTGNDIGLWESSVASDTLNVECAVCHTIHAQGSEPLGLRLPEDELCAQCHNAELAEGESFELGAEIHSPAAEMREGDGMIGVEQSGEQFMVDATCVDCHMPGVRGEGHSHAFDVMTPGNATTWSTTGDSCSPCHPTRSRSNLQSFLDTWKADLDNLTAEASAAIAAAEARPAGSTDAGEELIGSAKTNIAFVAADGSHGAHNYPYAKAGLEKAVYWARSTGATFTRLGATGFDSTMQMAMVYGTFDFGDGEAAAGETVVIEAKPGGTSSWVPVGEVVVGADGDFSFGVSPSGTTAYRARFTPKSAATAVYSKTATVYRTSSTTVRASSTSFPLGRTITVSGVVSPNHAGSSVKTQYKLGSGSWRTLTTRTLSSSSTYSFSWKPTSRGTYYLKTTFGGDSSHKGSTSSTISTRVY